MQPGKQLGKYVLRRRIGTGGMAEVWAADVEGKQGFSKPVAIKVMLESFTGDPERERLFVREAQVAARLSHPNLVGVFDFDQIPGQARRYYIAMELVEGVDLARVLRKLGEQGRMLPAGLCLHVAAEALKGLRHLHDRAKDSVSLGLVHRDVSPHNILISFDGVVKVSDFGIAKSTMGLDASGTGTFRGKIHYASPEQIRGERVDSRADQFAAGCVLWEMLTGRKAFGGETAEVLRKIASGTPEAPAAGNLPVALEAIGRRMMDPDPNRRFPSTKRALAAILEAPGYDADGAKLGTLLCTLFGEMVPGTFVPNVPSRPVTLERLPGGVDAGPAPSSSARTRAEGPSTIPSATPPTHVLDEIRKLPPTRTRNVFAPGAPAPQPREGSESVPATTPEARRRGRSRSSLVLALAGICGALALVAVAVGAYVKVRAPRSLAVRPGAGSAGRLVAQPVAPAPAVPPPALAAGAQAEASRPTGAAEPRAQPESARVSPPSGKSRPRRRARAAAPAPEAQPPRPDIEDAMARARAAFESGNRNVEAIMLARKAVRLGGGADAWVLLGHASVRVADWEEALMAYGTALEIDPKHSAAQQGYEMVKRKRQEGAPR